MIARGSLVLVVVTLALTGQSAVADTLEGPQLHIGGYAQPQYRLRQDCKEADPSVTCQGTFVGAFDTTDENGFTLKRARLTLSGAQPTWFGVNFSFELEAEMTPEFQLRDAFVRATGALPGDGRWRVELGQVKAPISRQILVSDAELQMVEKAQLTSLAPDRQLGLRATVAVPFVPALELTGSVFNGDGANQLTNIDERYLWAGRAVFHVFGRPARVTEGGFGETEVTVGISGGRNRQLEGSIETVSWFAGGDVFGSWQGISGTAEYLLLRTDFRDEPAAGEMDRDFDGEGFNVQLGYLLPIPGLLYRRFEVAARLEEIDRNDTIAIQGPGDVNQSLRNYVVGLAYYHREHNLKAQLALTHTSEVEDVNFEARDATYPNDTLLVQVSYRLE